MVSIVISVRGAVPCAHVEGTLMAETASNRIVITVLGEANVDIRDITQSILEDIFTMTMLADCSESTLDFTDLQEALVQAGELSGVTVNIQREDVFNFMYRL